jgi:hypothetical protein
MTALPKHDDNAADRKELDELARSFDRLYAKLRPTLEPALVGQYIVIQVKTGQYVVARKYRDAMALAEQTFGTSDYCWSRKIGSL